MSFTTGHWLKWSLAIYCAVCAVRLRLHVELHICLDVLALLVDVLAQNCQSLHSHRTVVERFHQARLILLCRASLLEASYFAHYREGVGHAAVPKDPFVLHGLPTKSP